MPRRNVLTLALCVAATLVLTSRPARAQTTAVGPYLATPSWDQTLPCTTLATCPRFVVLSNFGSDAVLDRETGLVWDRSPDPTNVTFHQAVTSCAFSSVGGRFGWRLATIHELLSLFDPASNTNPFLPAGNPFAGIGGSVEYCSVTTTTVSGATFAYQVGLNPFNLQLGSSNIAVGQVARAWCVRGGPGAFIE